MNTYLKRILILVCPSSQYDKSLSFLLKRFLDSWARQRKKLGLELACAYVHADITIGCSHK